jgi:methyltransferase
MTLAVSVLTFVALLRFWELYVSQSRARAEIATGRASLIREPFYPLMVAVHAGWWVGCAAEPVLAQRSWQPGVAVPALLVWAAALALRFWLMATLGPLWNVRLLRRTAQPVISTGPYRFIRHPNYLAVILELAAVPLALGAYFTALAAGVANALVLWQRIRQEEAYLFSVPAYAAAFARRKRLIPLLF